MNHDGNASIHIRRLLTERVHNMRELGGYATTGGSLTQWRRFIRSDAPLSMTADDAAYLRDYGVRTVIDLRTPDEAAWQPCILQNAPGFEYANISFTDDFTYLGAADYCPRDHLVPVIKGSHRAGEVLSNMARSDGAVLFFCYAGKDRTGMIAALLLLTAGVPVEDVTADYQVTYTYIRSKLASRANDVGWRNAPLDVSAHNRKRPEGLRRTEPEWIEPFIEYVLGFGGIDAFLTHIGLSAGEIAALRQKLVG